MVLAAMRVAMEAAAALTHSTVEVVHIHLEKLVHIPREEVGKDREVVVAEAPKKEGDRRVRTLTDAFS